MSISYDFEKALNSNYGAFALNIYYTMTILFLGEYAILVK